MNSVFILMAIAISICITYTYAQDRKYCDASLCRAGRRHIGCPGVAVNQCPRDSREISLSGSLKTLILDMHNNYRNTLAGGSLALFSPAKRMPTLQWDNELANLARINAMQCKFAHDQCRNTRSFKYAGQNIAWSKNYPNHQYAVKKAIEGWWNEYKDASMSIIKRYRSVRGKVFGHFTAMAQDRTNRVGCAMSFYNTNERLIVCNYAFTNLLDSHVYVLGAPGSGCKTGRNPRYKNLCSTNEIVAALPY